MNPVARPGEIDPAAAGDRSATAWRRFVQRVQADLWIPPRNDLPALNGMRGFASILAVSYHCALFMGFYTDATIARGEFPEVRAVTNGFWTAIDMFFVLSGFLIGRILILDLVTFGRIRYRKFFIRRSFRIFPAYYLIITLSLFVIARTQPGLINFLYASADWDAIASGAWTNFVYLNNYLLAPKQPNILSWGWSLCVEEHFYAFLPPYLWLVFRVRGDFVRLVLIALGGIPPLIFRMLAFHANPDLRVLDGLYYHSHMRFDEVFVGVFIAYVSVVYPDVLRNAITRAGRWVPAVGLACVASVWFFGGLYRGGYFVVVWQFSVMALGSALVMLNGMYLDNRVTRFFTHRGWYPLARVSYGVYLLHPFLVFALLTLYRGQYGPQSLGTGGLVLLTIGTFALANLLAAVMFLVLERPLLDVGARLSQRYAQPGRTATASPGTV